MITAREARAFYEASGAKVNDLLALIEPEIIKAAKNGKQRLEYHCGSAPQWTTLTEVAEFEQAVIAKLRALGFSAHYGSFGSRYVPRGLADDEGNGPSHANYGYIIGW